MWLAPNPLSDQTGRRGFTIVELLIVIVIIGILAAITIVAYNGITQRAHVSALQSDLAGAAEQLEIDNTNNGSYPVTAAAANNGLGLKASPGTSYQYTYTSSGNSYCLTGTNSGVSYYVSNSTQSAQAGACSGDISGGVIAAPTGVTVGATDDNHIALTWTASSGATSYTAQCAADSGFTVNVHQATSSTTSVTVSSLSPSGTWWCEANASYSGGTSAWSSTVSTSLACPSGFIVVPGSVTYGTSDFCVMKYEAKQASSTVPISQASGTPWTNISQTTAIADSPNVAGCSGCHLITDAEWLTIAQNVMKVAGNWTSGTVGSGTMYVGHSDGAPGNALVADTNDANGYTGETNTGGNQRRTLTLSNGQVIWDLAGDVWEWTSGTTAGSQPGASGYAWRDWNTISGTGSLSPNPFPVYAYAPAGSWTTANGIGQAYTSSSDATLHGFARGANWFAGSYAGVFTLNTGSPPGYTTVDWGFRVSR